MSQPRRRAGSGSSTPTLALFATTSAGLEPALEAELRALGARGLERVRGGVGFVGDRRLMMAACVNLRTAHRVLWKLGEGVARDGDALYEGTRGVVRWEGLVPPDKTFAVRATVRDSALRDSRWVALRVKDAIVDAVRDARGERPSVDAADPDVRVQVRVARDRVTVSLDAAGDSLHARGYRTEAGEAPLRETMAAGMLLMSRWDGQAPLVDPMCGSGTLPIEAALLASGTAPGLLGRRFGFERWPGHRPAMLEAVVEEARRRARPRPEGALAFGRDRDARVVGLARDNARRAGVDGLTDFAVGELDALAPPPGASRGVLVTNPPYGERLGEIEGLVPLYRRLGAIARERFRGWELWILLAHDVHREALGLPIARQWPMMNGALEVTLAQIVIR